MASVSLLQKFFDSSVDLFCIASLEGYFLHINPAFKSVLGYELGELTSAPFLDFIHPDDREATLAEMGKLSGGLTTLYFENRYRCKDGSYKWLGWTSMPLVPDGVTYAVARDITRKKAEEAEAQWLRDQLVNEVEKHRTELSEAREVLGHTEEVLRMFVEHAPAAVAMFDQDMHYLIASRRWTTDYGLESTSFTGRSHYDVFPETPERWREIHRRCMNGTVEHSDGEEFVRADGSTDWVRWEMRPWFNRQGKIGGVIMFTEVMTEEKRLQDQLQQVQRLEAIGQLAGGIAHDFNNLLTVMRGRADFALQWLDPENPAYREVEVVVRTAERASTLTRQLLTFSRQQPVEVQPVVLNEVLADLYHLWERLLGEHVSIQLVPATGLWPINGNRSQIEQIMMNLVINARDAMPSGGRLTVETQNASLDEEYARLHAGVEPGEYVMLAVSDTGIGMDAATRQRIFDPFFTTKGPGKGTGLGLSTVYGIVRQNKGHIWVYSEPGKGSIFRIYLPRIAEAASVAGEKRAVPAVPPGARGEETILLVEDEEGVRDLARDILQAGGYRVLEATNGVAAKALLENYKGSALKLILTDVVMPEMGGPDLVRWARERVGGVKVVYMSGYSEQGGYYNGTLENGGHYLQKPFTPAALRRKVREVLDE